MVKVIIELRDKDIDGNILDNSKAIEEITNHANKYWDCKSVGVEKGLDITDRELANLFERFFSKWVKDNKEEYKIIEEINTADEDFLEYSRKIIEDINKLDNWVV